MTKVVVSGYSPQISHVGGQSGQSSAPVLNTVQSSGAVQQQRAPAQQARPPQQKRKPTSNRPKPGPGYIPPATGYIPPTQGGVTLSESGTGPAAPVNMSNLVSQLIQQASGGNLIATNNEPVSGADDINERF